MKLLLDNLPPALQPHRDALASCLRGFSRARHIRAVYLFGSHARGEARADSDVDLCVVADGAEKQLKTASDLRAQLWGIWPRPALTIVPISPQRLQEKRDSGDHFYKTVLREGVLLATEN